MANILFITNSISFGGAEKMLCFVAESLADRGHSVVIANLKTTKNKTDYERELSSNILVYTIKKPPANKNKNIHYIKEIKKIGKEHNSEIVIGFTGFPNMYARIVGTMLKIPSIMSERGDPSRTNNKSFKSRIMRFIINCSKGGVFQTEGAKNYFGKGLQKRGIIIPNPIFIKGKIPNVRQCEREKTVVTVGRLDNKQKRYDIMLQAFKIFSEKHSDYVLKIYGRGMDEDKIRKWASELGISEKVHFMGLTTQPMRDIAKDGMFLITSDYEGISNSLLEAMAVGLPCVSTDHTPGGARLLISDHENGLLAPIGNPIKIAECMCEFAENPVLAEKCGNNARDVTNRFEPKKIIDMWENYILSICNRS